MHRAEMLQGLHHLAGGLRAALQLHCTATQISCSGSFQVGERPRTRQRAALLLLLLLLRR